MGQTLVPDFLHAGIGCFFTGAEQAAQKQDLPIRMVGQKSCALAEAPGIETIEEDVILKYDDALCAGLQAFTKARHVGFIVLPEHPGDDV